MRREPRLLNVVIFLDVMRLAYIPALRAELRSAPSSAAAEWKMRGNREYIDISYRRMRIQRTAWSTDRLIS